MKYFTALCLPTKLEMQHRAGKGVAAEFLLFQMGIELHQGPIHLNLTAGLCQPPEACQTAEACGGAAGICECCRGKAAR